MTVLYQSSDARTGTLVTGYMPVEIESELSLQGIAETTVGRMAACWARTPAGSKRGL